MVKRVIVLGAVALLLCSSPAALAQGYGRPAALTVSDTTVNPGQAVTVRGSGYADRAQVTLIFESTPVELGRAIADDSGSFTRDVTIPANATAGNHTIRARGLGANGSSLEQSVRVAVLGASAGGGPGANRAANSSGLARTGSDGAISLTQLGAVLILLGAGVVAVVRRRRVISDITRR